MYIFYVWYKFLGFNKHINQEFLDQFFINYNLF